MECKFCKKTFSSEGNLKKHQEKTKKCLSLQNKKADKIYECEYCKKEFTVKVAYQQHVSRHINNPKDQENERLRRENMMQKQEIARLEQDIVEQKSRNEKKDEIIERLALKAIEGENIINNYYNETHIDVEKLTPVNAELIRLHTPKDFSFDAIFPMHNNI